MAIECMTRGQRRERVVTVKRGVYPSLDDNSKYYSVDGGGATLVAVECWDEHFGTGWGWRTIGYKAHTPGTGSTLPKATALPRPWWRRLVGE